MIEFYQSKHAAIPIRTVQSLLPLDQDEGHLALPRDRAEAAAAGRWEGGSPLFPPWLRPTLPGQAMGMAAACPCLRRTVVLMLP